MEQMNCFFYNQGAEFCGHRASRHATSFEVRMIEGFNDGLTVPCKIRQFVNRICDKKWMVASCRGREYDFYLQKLPNSTEMCGPYWRSFIRVHNVELGDIVNFIYVEDDDLFYCSVYQIVDDIKVLKEFTSPAVLFDVADDIRETVHNIDSRSMRNITELEMASILSSIMKYIYAAPAQDIADGEFYVPANEVQFIIEKYTTENVNDECLYFPAFAVRGLNMPGFGDTVMYHKNVKDSIECKYLINGDDNTGVVILQEGWADMVAAIHAGVGSVLVAKIYVRGEHRMFLHFDEVVNPVNPVNPANA